MTSGVKSSSSVWFLLMFHGRRVGLHLEQTFGLCFALNTPLAGIIFHLKRNSKPLLKTKVSLKRNPALIFSAVCLQRSLYSTSNSALLKNNAIAVFISNRSNCDSRLINEPKSLQDNQYSFQINFQLPYGKFIHPSIGRSEFLYFFFLLPDTKIIGLCQHLEIAISLPVLIWWQKTPQQISSERSANQLFDMNGFLLTLLKWSPFHCA